MDPHAAEHKQPLLEDNEDSAQRLGFRLASTHVKPQRQKLFVGIIVLQALLSVILLGAGWSYHGRCASLQLPYSPMESSIPFVARRLNTSIGDGKTEFMGQSREVDERWEMLFKFGVQQTPKDVARLLADPTAPIPGDLDNYIFSYEVFHLLHCLNLLRKRFHPEYYPPPPPEDTIAHQHGDHCVDFLRQSLMCMVDINPMVWQWNEAKQMTLPKLDALHECRNWDDVWNWSVDHRIRTPFEKHLHLATGS